MLPALGWNSGYGQSGRQARAAAAIGPDREMRPNDAPARRPRRTANAPGLSAAESGALQQAGVLASAAPDAPGTIQSTRVQPS